MNDTISLEHADALNHNVSVQQAVAETDKLGSIAVNLSSTGLLGAGLAASALEPENSLEVAAYGAALLLPTLKAMYIWCEHRCCCETPEPLGVVLTAAAQCCKECNSIKLATIGVAAATSTLIAMHVASPDYNYDHFASNEADTRLVDPKACNKLFSSIKPLTHASRTIKELTLSTRSNAPERATKLKLASMDYLRFALSKKESPEYKKLFTPEEANAIATAPYLRALLPEFAKMQYTEDALARIKSIPPAVEQKEVSNGTKDRYVQALVQLCLYSNNPETKEIVKTSWLSMAEKTTPSKHQKPAAPFHDGIKAAVAEVCDDELFMP